MIMHQLKKMLLLAAVSMALAMTFGFGGSWIVDTADAQCFTQTRTRTCATQANCSNGGQPCSDQTGTVLYGDCPAIAIINGPTPRADVFDMGGNNEYDLIGRERADLICGDFRDDVIEGGAGGDSIDGEGPDDDIDGGAGNDIIFAGGGDDQVSGGGGADTIEGEDNNDLLRGNGGNDEIDGGDDEDTLLGNAGRDELAGGDNDDSLNGGAGFDECDGAGGDDVFSGCEDEDED
jgi:Ca2+-binding RTX toxin-like protein